MKGEEAVSAAPAFRALLLLLVYVAHKPSAAKQRCAMLSACCAAASRIYNSRHRMLYNSMLELMLLAEQRNTELRAPFLQGPCPPPTKPLPPSHHGSDGCICVALVSPALLLCQLQCPLFYAFASRLPGVCLRSRRNAEYSTFPYSRIKNAAIVLSGVLRKRLAVLPVVSRFLTFFLFFPGLSVFSFFSGQKYKDRLLLLISCPHIYVLGVVFCLVFCILQFVRLFRFGTSEEEDE